MRWAVDTLRFALPWLGSIAMVLMVFYVFDAVASHLWGYAFPYWLGPLGCSLHTLFQVMTLESWSMGIARLVMEMSLFAWVFFISFILFAAFTMLSLCVAITANAMQTFSKNEYRATETLIETVGHSMEHGLHAEALWPRQKIRELRSLLLSVLHSPTSLISPFPKESPPT